MYFTHRNPNVVIIIPLIYTALAASSTPTSLNIEIDFLSPLPNHTYTPTAPFPISIQVLNAVPTFTYGFTISFNITSSISSNITIPNVPIAQATYVAACCSSPPPSANSSLWTWDGSGDPLHPSPFSVPVGQWAMSWNYSITSVCYEVGYSTILSNPTVAASGVVDFTVAINGTAAGTGTGNSGNGVTGCVVGAVINITKNNELDNCAELGSRIFSLPSTCGASLSLGSANGGLSIGAGRHGIISNCLGVVMVLLPFLIL